MINVTDRFAPSAAILTITLDGVRTEERVTFHPMRGRDGSIVTDRGEHIMLINEMASSAIIARRYGADPSTVRAVVRAA